MNFTWLFVAVVYVTFQGTTELREHSPGDERPPPDHT